MLLMESVSIWNLPRPEGSVIVRLLHPALQSLGQLGGGTGGAEERGEGERMPSSFSRQQVSPREVAGTGWREGGVFAISLAYSRVEIT